MKQYRKKLIAGILAAALAVAAVGCSTTGTDSATASTAGGSQTSGAPAAKKIGVIQYAPHPSLDNCYEGFKKGLADEGYVEGQNLTIDFQNAQGESATADTEAQTMAAKQYDLIGAIATPAAMSAYAATKADGTPMTFISVNDPVASQLVKSLEKPGTNCTGSSDVLPLESQLKMIRAFLPNAKKIGVLYTTSESNSVSVLAQCKKLAPKYNFEVVEQGVTNSSEVASGAEALVAKGVDCFNNFTDNNVVNNLTSELQVTNKAKIPVFGSEIEQVKNGCIASVSIDFVALGEETGKMAGKILKGESKPEDTPVYVVQDGTPVYNKAVMQQLGITLPADYQSAQAVEANS